MYTAYMGFYHHKNFETGDVTIGLTRAQLLGMARVGSIKREDYIRKFKTLTENIIDYKESDRFLNDVQSLRELGKSDLHKLNIEVKNDLRKLSSFKKTIF